MTNQSFELMCDYDSINDSDTVEFCMEEFIKSYKRKEHIKNLFTANKIKECYVKLEDIKPIIKKYNKTTFKSRLIRKYFSQ